MQKGTARGEAETASGIAGEDRLTELPDDVLLNVLERLDTLNALRACILSKRLLKLPAMFSRFDINVGYLGRYRNKAHPYTIAHLVRYNNAVAAVTEKILSARNREMPICKLKVGFYLRPDECRSISKAVARTMATQKVDGAEFYILTKKGCLRCTHDDLLCYAKQFNAWLGDCPAAFAGLTRLWIRNMRFGELEDIPNLLSICKRLESLRLSYCDAGVGSVLQVEHAQLVQLQIDHGNFEAVQLNFLPKLQRVTYVGWASYNDPLTFGYVPQLRKLSLGYRAFTSSMNIQLSQILADAPLVSDLHLDFKSEKIWVLPERRKLLAPVLRNLEIVNLVNLPEGCDIAWTMFILEAAPSLKECIRVWDHWCEMLTDKDYRRKCGYWEKANLACQPSASDFKQKNLVKLTVYGFEPDEHFVRYVRRIMEVAVNMAEISLHDREVCQRCGDLDPNIKVSPSRYPRTGEEKTMLREEITKELRMASPALIHFRS